MEVGGSVSRLVVVPRGEGACDAAKRGLLRAACVGAENGRDGGTHAAGTTGCLQHRGLAPLGESVRAMEAHPVTYQRIRLQGGDQAAELIGSASAQLTAAHRERLEKARYGDTRAHVSSMAMERRKCGHRADSLRQTLDCVTVDRIT